MKRWMRFALLCAPTAIFADTGLEFFESKIRPILVEHCYDCHSGAKTKGGLSLETKAGWSQGGDSGPAIVPGKPDESLLIRAVRYTDEDLAMPPNKKGGKLSDAQIAAFEEWVRIGAPDPREPAAKIGGMHEAEARTWWSFQPLAQTSRTGVSALRSQTDDAAQSTADTLVRPGAENYADTLVRSGASIDAFIDLRLKAAGLQPLPAADRRTLIRRATFDLTGLPPTSEEVEFFVTDPSQDAFAKVIERLLASPHYGEKWGRHWLDVVRYADSLDSRIYDKDGDILDAWRYRDWVVAAFNNDLPYDQFIIHQLAGDILAARQWDAQKMIATGLYAIGNWGNGDADKEKVHTDIVDDQIDVTGRAFLGLTLACARCHDHKFDPITTRDYYSLAGIFFSSHILDKFAAKSAGEKLMRIPLLSPGEAARHEKARKRIAEIEVQLSGALEPFTEVKTGVAGKPGLISWNGRGASNPSLVINTTAAAVAFSTIKLPARAIAVHPGPKVAASAVWRSPVSGRVTVSAQLEDADPNCGDGILWLMRHGGKTLQSGEMNNGTSAGVPGTSVVVQAGDLLQLIIRPRGEYTCDTTQIDLIVRDERGQEWNLREALVGGAAQGQDNLWWVCSGEGATLNKDAPEVQTLTAERKRLDEVIARTEFAQGLQEGGIPLTSYAGYHDAAVHKRGRYDQLGDVIPRGFPSLLTTGEAAIRKGSGRLELARWIANAGNPLTARVMVNRIWQHHFGQGLVRTPNNFGKLGTPPTHPKLLDWLAAEFIRSGWSVKHMHRVIMGTTAYQRASSAQFSVHSSQTKAGSVANHTEHFRQMLAEDPNNELLARQHRRRLTAEELRDAMLHAAGRLDLSVGGKSMRDILVPRRTLYLTTIRSDRTSYQALFDGADPTAIVEQRTEATVAPQSLFLLNHPFTLAQAEALSAAAAQAGTDPSERVRWLWRRLFHRAPAPEDEALAIRALGTETNAAPWTAFCQMLLCSNEFAYVD